MESSDYINQKNKIQTGDEMIKRGFIYGTITGFLLGFILFIIEKTLDIKLFTLLLNIDFIPIIGDISFPVYIEFFFHLIVSWTIAIIFVWIATLLNIHSFLHIQFIALLITLPAFFIYIPLTTWAIKDVPAPYDLTAFTYWSLSHLIYSICLGILYYQNIKSNDN